MSGNEEEIVAVLQEQQNSGRTAAEVAMENGISENTVAFARGSMGHSGMNALMCITLTVWMKPGRSLKTGG